MVDRSYDFATWLSERRTLSAPPEDAGEHYALEIREWKAEPFAIPKRPSMERRLRARPALVKGAAA